MDIDKIAKKLAFDEEEEVISVLGQSWLDSLITNGIPRKTVMLLTDKRLYVWSRRIAHAGLGNIKADINVNDLSGSSFNVRSRQFVRIMLVLFGLIGFLILANVAIEYAIVCLLVFALLIYLNRDMRTIGIITNGVEYLFPVKGHSPEEIRTFRVAIALMVEAEREA